MIYYVTGISKSSVQKIIVEILELINELGRIFNPFECTLNRLIYKSDVISFR